MIKPTFGLSSAEQFPPERKNVWAERDWCKGGLNRAWEFRHNRTVVPNR